MSDRFCTRGHFRGLACGCACASWVFAWKKKKKRGVGVGLVSLMQLTSLASSTKRKHASRAWWLSNSGASKPLKRLLLRAVLLEVTIQYLQFDFVEYLMVFCCILEVSKGPYQCFFLQVLSLFLQIEWCCCVLEQFQGSVVFTSHFSTILKIYLLTREARLYHSNSSNTETQNHKNANSKARVQKKVRANVKICSSGEKLANTLVWIL